MYSWTPLLMGVRGNYPAIVSLLLQHSPNVNAVDQEGMTALAIACKEGCIDIAFQLLAAGAYVNIQVTVVPACFNLLL
jgi:ankyrin repeat-rich membrane spanning protein